MKEEFLKNICDADYQIFGLVAGMLYAMAKLTGLSYFAVNIITYYIIIPITYLIYGFPKLKWSWVGMGLLLMVGYIILPNMEIISKECFDISVVFLNKVGEVLKVNYIQSSVYVCVYLWLIGYFVIDLASRRFRRIKLWIIGLIVVVAYNIFLSNHIGEIIKRFVK